jgi:hypothetical protein
MLGCTWCVLQLSIVPQSAQAQNDAAVASQPATRLRNTAPRVDSETTRSPSPVNALDSGTMQVHNAEKPWSVGVHPEAQLRARTLFAEGTDFLLRSLEEQAIEKYDAALQLWDHPGIHYNYAVALSTQDRALETRKHLLEALRYGDEGPLDRLEVEQARRYLKLVEGSLALVDIRAEQSGVVVSLNGEVLFTGPGQYRRFLGPAEYLITAAKPGYIGHERRVAFLPGKTNTVQLRLYSEQELTRYKRRWSPWGPVTVTAVGAVTTLGGAAAWLVAEGKYSEYDREVSVRCPTGCASGDPALDSLQSTKDSADTYNAAALPLMIGGGITVAAGAVLLYLNRAEAYQISPEEAGVAHQLSFLPVVGPHGAELTTRFRF